MNNIKKQKNNSGFSLIEILIAVAILSIGLLGVAGLQINSQKAVYDSLQRTIATQLVQDMIERMRVNKGVLNLYVGKIVGSDIIIGGTIGNAPKDCSSVSCSETEIAEYDLWQWERSLDGYSEQVGSTETGGLQSPTGCIVGPAGGSGVYRVTIAWRGVQMMTNSTLDSCGNSRNLYNEDDSADDNKFRRLISIDTYISDIGVGS